MYEIHISWASNGFVVNAGCKRFVFPDRQSLITVLDRYLANPHSTQKDFLAGCVNEPHFQKDNIAPQPQCDPVLQRGAVPVDCERIANANRPVGSP